MGASWSITMSKHKNIPAIDDLFTPIGHDKDGPLYAQQDIEEFICNEININQHFTRIMKPTTKDLNNATEQLNEAQRTFTATLDHMKDSHLALETDTRAIAIKIKNTSNSLGQSLLKIEKQADFSKLEQYVVLLERAEAAMRSLAELEANGKLVKIASALK